MRFFSYAAVVGAITGLAMARPSEPSKHLRPLLEKRQQFPQGQPIDAQGNGGPILGIAFLLLILIACVCMLAERLMGED